MTKPGTKAKKAKSKEEAPLPRGSLSPKPNIMYIEVNRYTENTHYHTQMTHYKCFLILLTSDEKCAKATSYLSVSIDGQHSKVLQKPKAMRYAFLPKRTGLRKTSRQCLAHVPRLPSQGCRHRDPTCLWKPMWTDNQTTIPLHPSTQKAASRTAKKANAQGG